jgi:hypothetical protein
VRRLVVSRGTQFNVSVLDNDECTADIRASGGNKRIVSVSNPKSAGFVLDHTFEFTANRTGSTTYDLSVLGEAAAGGDPGCDEDSHNPLQIDVVEPSGDDRTFARAVKPEIRTLKQALKQVQAGLRADYGSIIGDFASQRVTLVPATEQIVATYNQAFFEQSSLVRSVFDTARDRERDRILSDPVLSRIPVANGLFAGGCGAWDDFANAVNGLISSSRDSIRSDTKKQLGRLTGLYEKSGGEIGLTVWFDCDDCYDCGGVSLALDDYEPKDAVMFSTIAALAYTEPDSNVVQRRAIVGAKARGSGITNVGIAIVGDMGEVARTDQVLLETRFVSVLSLPDNSIGVDLRVIADSPDVTLRGRGQRFQAANLFVGSRALGDF